MEKSLPFFWSLGFSSEFPLSTCSNPQTISRTCTWKMWFQMKSEKIGCNSLLEEEVLRCHFPSFHCHLCGNGIWDIYMSLYCNTAKSMSTFSATGLQCAILTKDVNSSSVGNSCIPNICLDKRPSVVCPHPPRENHVLALFKVTL